MGMHTFTFENIEIGSMFMFLDGAYKDLNGFKNGQDTAWMGTEWLCNRRNVPQIVHVDAGERVHLYSEEE